jgi:hypothetical protein
MMDQDRAIGLGSADLLAVNAALIFRRRRCSTIKQQHVVVGDAVDPDTSHHSRGIASGRDGGGAAAVAVGGGVGNLQQRNNTTKSRHHSGVGGVGIGW